MKPVFQYFENLTTCCDVTIPSFWYKRCQLKSIDLDTPGAKKISVLPNFRAGYPQTKPVS